MPTADPARSVRCKAVSPDRTIPLAYDEKTAGRVRQMLAERRGVVEKKLMGGLCFMVDDAMCCSVSGKGGLLVRVGADARRHRPDGTCVDAWAAVHGPRA